MKVFHSTAVLFLSLELNVSCGGTAIGNGNNVQVGTIAPSAMQLASLSCEEISEARTGIESALVGCNLVDANGAAVDTEANAISVKYSVSSPSDTVAITITPLTFKDRLYDVTALLKSKDSQSVIAYAETFKLSAVATYGSGETKSFISPKPKKFSPSTSTSSWTVVEKAAEKYVVDRKTGLKWRPFTNQESIWNEAVKNCADSTYAGITSWRLPELSEFYAAAGSGIYDASSASALGFLNYGHLFWANIPADKKLPNGSIENANLYDFTLGLDQTITRYDIGSRRLSICVAD